MFILYLIKKQIKKSIGVLILGLILILNLFGCGKREEVKEEISMNISTGDNISGDNKNLDSSGSKDSNIITNTENRYPRPYRRGT